MSGRDSAIEQILEQAIRFEEDAYQFYTQAVGMVRQPHIQDVLRDLAGQEQLHKEKIQALLEGSTESIIATQKRGQIQDLKLAEYLVPRPIEQGASFQDVLIVAMHREKSSYDFYSTMVGLAQDVTARSLFEYLAAEEQMHKNKVESLYDEVVYQEN